MFSNALSYFQVFHQVHILAKRLLVPAREDILEISALALGASQPSQRNMLSYTWLVGILMTTSVACPARLPLCHAAIFSTWQLFRRGSKTFAPKKEKALRD